jgi:hypothetical protein
VPNLLKMDVPALFVTAPDVAIPTLVAVSMCDQEQYGLAFAQSMEPNALVGHEMPLMRSRFEDAESHYTMFNDRPAWSLVQEAFETLPASHRTAILEANYAKGIVHATRSWEEADQKILEKMSERFGIENKDVLEVYDIMATNNLVAQLFEVPGLAGIGEQAERDGRRVIVRLPLSYGFFGKLSRANHSCDPSARLDVPLSTGPIAVYTTRKVKRGEELTIDYLQNRPAKGKREALLEAFGFRCTCKRCVSLCALPGCEKVGEFICARCHKSRYCDRAHQRADWVRHKISCK